MGSAPTTDPAAAWTSRLSGAVASGVSLLTVLRVDKVIIILVFFESPCLTESGAVQS